MFEYPQIGVNGCVQCYQYLKVYAVDICHLHQFTDFCSTGVFFRASILSGHIFSSILMLLFYTSPEVYTIIGMVSILYIYGCYMKERGKLLTNTVVTTVMSNFGLYKALDEKGIGYAKTAVGDKYVYEYMAKNGCRIGGEQSGHIIFSKYASTGDGILTSLRA